MARKLSARIQDGYTFTGIVPGRKNVYDPVKIKYRPALPKRVTAYLAAINNATPEQIMSAMVALLEEHVIEWSETDEYGNSIPVKAEHLRQVYHPILGRMADLVAGWAEAEAEEDAKN
jgi:hypothetical protein